MADLQDLVCHTVKEISVMCYHDHNPLKTVEIILQPCSHLIIQMVRRLIQNQNICRVCQDCCQCHTFFLSAGKMFNLFFMILDPQSVEDHMRLCLRIPVLILLSLCHIGKNRCVFGKFRMLRKISNAKPVLCDHLTFIRFLQSRKDFKKGCFACSIDTDNSYLSP